MIYISEKKLRNTVPDWSQNIDVIEDCVRCMRTEDFVQPIKPYLRFRNLTNRIIAMPAFVGGDINMCGIKWISSFPENPSKFNVPRANCAVIINNPETGEIDGIINSARISSLRTASVSGFVIRKYLDTKHIDTPTIGIIGFGPIGQYHLDMCASIVKTSSLKILIYDLKEIDEDKIPDEIRHCVEIVDSWQNVYDNSDIFMTCTVSKERYIDRKPKPGSLHLNVSLRDYKSDVFSWFKDGLIVDNWEEVCRENTDIEMFHLKKGLQKADVVSMDELLDSTWMKSLSDEQAILFNPMGMAIFDIGISQYYLDRMKLKNEALILED